MPEYTEEEVAEHNTKDDLWLIIHGGVYNVSSYLNEHPGGELVLLQNGGMDATDEFEDNGHSEDARKLMADFKIGELKGNKKPEETKQSCTCWLKSLIKPTLLVGTVVVLALVLRRFKYST